MFWYSNSNISYLWGSGCRNIKRKFKAKIMVVPNSQKTRKQTLIMLIVHVLIRRKWHHNNRFYYHTLGYTQPFLYHPRTHPNPIPPLYKMLAPIIHPYTLWMFNLKDPLLQPNPQNTLGLAMANPSIDLTLMALPTKHDGYVNLETTTI